MKFHFKIFLMSFIICSIAIGSGFTLFNKFLDAGEKSLADDRHTVKAYETHEIDAEKTELEKKIDKSSRINVLMYGTDGGRSDTIMVLSYDPVSKVADIISIPRDTYHPTEGYEHPAQKKINAIIGLKNGGGSDSLKKAVSETLKIPISNYVGIEYEGIRQVVNSVGGVEVDVPFAMDYDDPYADPPLHIHLKPGYQTLNGDKAIQFLRWRKNNGTGGDGDLPRTERQQAFMKSLLQKCISLKLPSVIKTASKYLDTDMDMDRMVYLGASATGFQMDNLQTHRLPGVAEGVYYMQNDEDTDKMMIEVYSRYPKGSKSGDTAKNNDSN